jgi:hypothetical protein
VAIAFLDPATAKIPLASPGAVGCSDRLFSSATNNQNHSLVTKDNRKAALVGSLWCQENP